MLRKVTSLLLAVFTTAIVHAQNNTPYQTLWQNIGQAPAPAKGAQKLFPSAFQQFSVNESRLEQLLLTAGDAYETGVEIVLPAPDGSYRIFRVWRNTTMSKELQAAYPMINTWTGEDVNNRRITAELDYTTSGFHAMVFEAGSNWFVDPVTNQKTGYYLSYRRADYTRPLNQRMSCLNGMEMAREIGLEPMLLSLEKKGSPGLKVHGSQRRDYRLALACTYEYSMAVTGSTTPEKADVISAMVTTMNRVNGIYKRELSVNMTMIDNTDIVYVTSADPYTNDDTNAMLDENQANVDNVIGPNNYDIGHVFGTSGGGVASLASVCGSDKARAVTSLEYPIGDFFDVDYVCHEMGHQFGADHTFNNNQDGSCAGNMEPQSAYEPGSGSTIMCYAGLCGSDNLQDHSDPYFHVRNLGQITEFITVQGGASCGISTTSTNNPPAIAAFTAEYSIPTSTPFELTAPEATDATSDTLTYNWEQFNRGNLGARWANTMSDGPIFRSLPPTEDPTRVFPTLPRLLDNYYPYLGEKLPTVPRRLTFRLSVRDIYEGWGCLNLPEDSIVLHVIGGTGPFTVNGPSAPVNWLAGSVQLIQWNVANTTQAPISADSVDIYLSVDGGYTYPYLLAEKTLNDGEEPIIVPALNTTKARIKVKASGNVFFNVNSINFGITTGLDIEAFALADAVTVYPVPAHKEAFVNVGDQQLQGVITNALGQLFWQGKLQGKTNLDVSGWAPGVYYLKCHNQSGAQAVKTLVVY